MSLASPDHLICIEYRLSCELAALYDVCSLKLKNGLISTCSANTHNQL